MTDLRKAAEMALEALKDTHYRIIDAGLLDQDLLDRNFTVATALRQALAQPEQEPVAWMGVDSWGVVTKFRTNPFGGAIPLYKTPPKQEWDGPTDEEYENFCSLIQREEAKLKDKNT